jgi:hypothetical protein
MYIFAVTYQAVVSQEKKDIVIPVKGRAGP